MLVCPLTSAAELFGMKHPYFYLLHHSANPPGCPHLSLSIPSFLLLSLSLFHHPTLLLLRKIESYYLSIDSFPECLQYPGLGQAGARSQELSLSLPTWVAGIQVQESSPVACEGAHLSEAESGVELGLEPQPSV